MYLKRRKDMDAHQKQRQVLKLLQELWQESTGAATLGMIAEVRAATNGWENAHKERGKKAIADLAASFGLDESSYDTRNLSGTIVARQGTSTQKVVDLVVKNYKTSRRFTTNDEIFRLGVSKQAPYNAKASGLIKRAGRGAWAPV
jgi:hypothetical protein